LKLRLGRLVRDRAAGPRRAGPRRRCDRPRPRRPRARRLRRSTRPRRAAGRPQTPAQRDAALTRGLARCGTRSRRAPAAAATSRSISTSSPIRRARRSSPTRWRSSGATPTTRPSSRPSTPATGCASRRARTSSHSRCWPGRTLARRRRQRNRRAQRVVAARPARARDHGAMRGRSRYCAGLCSRRAATGRPSVRAKRSAECRAILRRRRERNAERFAGGA